MKAMFERYVAQEDFDYRIRLNYWEDEQYCSKHTKSFDFFKNIQNEFEFGKTPNIINKWINELSSLGYAISSKFQWQEHLFKVTSRLSFNILIIHYTLLLYRLSLNIIIFLLITNFVRIY